jgi:mono/diheme cytochrome c family protein
MERRFIFCIALVLPVFFWRKHPSQKRENIIIMNYRKIYILLVCLFFVVWQSCRKDYTYVSPPPPGAHSTDSLEVVLVTTPPNKITSPYWGKANYLAVHTADVSKSMLYQYGWLNMTGTYNGLNSFSSKSPSLTLKAAYDNDNLYILAEWLDTVADFSYGSWFYNGPTDPRKSDTATGWTKQKNCDRLAMAFEINSASGGAGAFSSVGCAASCHGSGSSAAMYPSAGSVDIWNWNTAHSAPLGYAEDMVANAGGLSSDAGNKMWAPNDGANGPMYEWNGVAQNITLPNGSAAILDPAYYLMNTTSFTGNAHGGDTIFHKIYAGNADACSTCHGEKGEGGDYGALNSVAFNGKSRSTLITSMNNQPEMATYFPKLDSAALVNVLAYIRGMAGVPGAVLSMPTGSNADITAISNVTPIDIKNAYLPKTNKHVKYQVLITRKLKTNNADDVQFDLSKAKTYVFGIALMDNDAKNHIGSTKEVLIFK